MSAQFKIPADEMEDEPMTFQEGNDNESDGYLEDDENTSSNNNNNNSASSSDETELYDLTPSSVFKFITSCSINLILPFINGMMLGFGEILAHEIGFKYGWLGARVYPQKRMIFAREREQEKAQQEQQRKSAFL
ncbi:hypothetical protein PACTADRAFT_48706 [Pachysolen tannophilus NRRL Y-2460]|uniref:Mitochondrial import protein 1 n=1 Tax=Pachysolen tannophilus NRRL Y-2460 TaxID=669874 RepID=A0A1E4TYU7_PACTA|nr:hypothetical protein PACTADRAFT_48706 [Pachysolen tannophilus NRRL Y-2460]